MNTKLKQFAILGAVFTVILFSSFLPEASHKQYLTARVIEFMGQSGMFDSKIVVTDEKGQVEETDLANLKSKNYKENAQAITGVLNNIAAKGYELISSSSSGVVATYVFEKK